MYHPINIFKLAYFYSEKFGVILLDSNISLIHRSGFNGTFGCHLSLRQNESFKMLFGRQKNGVGVC